jgi:hypothetical protein
LMKRTAFAAMLLLASFMPAQTTQSPVPPSMPQPPAQVDVDPPKKEHIVTPEETKELFESLDEILTFASQDTLLPLKHPVKRNMVSRAEVEKYIGDKFKDDADRIRFERSELVMKKFGFLPRKFNLHDFLIKLLGEQVAGYYDEETKVMNMLNWVEMDMQKPVMAHELTHALQDQNFDLQKMTKHDEEIEKRGAADPNALIMVDEESTARSAVMEGQAMIVLFDYMLAPTGRTVEGSPQLIEMMESQMDKPGDSPLLDSAPLMLREDLLFPYGPGMKFIAKLLKSGGKKLAFTGVLERMPLTTREILEPEEYLAGRRVKPLLLPDLGFLKKDYEPFDAGAVGEQDVKTLLKQYAEDSVALRMAPEWRGGSYYAAARRTAKPTDSNSSAHIGLLYVYRWSSDQVAGEFAKIYASALPDRYNKVSLALYTGPAKGREKYQTADGVVFIQHTGDTVIAVESFDEPAAAKIIEETLKKIGAESKASL